MKEYSLRHALRDGTRIAHERLDDAAAIDLSSPDGYACFARGHAIASQKLIGSGSPEQSLLRHRLSLANSDLAALGEAPIPAKNSQKCKGECIATTYVIAGSHLGAAYLAKRALTSPHGDWALLTDITLPPLWKALVKTMRDQSGTGPDAEAIVARANTVFEIFHDAFQTARKPG